ncbi:MULTISPECIES: hypothetical protein [Kocuria]|uniref:Uncharacterized protein n=1 Tax=Kocuria subflava TaxID=1736139 RepID=A0A846TVQ7_9MICC|nr:MULTISPECIES: hypothetical protein [Kocuria]NKE09852.1 hypothetical protein [Kocuria subflava]
MQQNDPQATAAGKGQDSIKMDPAEEQEVLDQAQSANSSEVDPAEPADEGVGAMTDDQDITPATDN